MECDKMLYHRHLPKVILVYYVPVAVRRQWSSIKRTLNSQHGALHEAKEIIHVYEDTRFGFPVHVDECNHPCPSILDATDIYIRSMILILLPEWSIIDSVKTISLKYAHRQSTFSLIDFLHIANL